MRATLVATALLLASILGHRDARALEPDPTFPSVLVNGGDAYSTGRAVLVDPTGRIVVAGGVGATTAAQDLLLVRLLPDGSLDPDFGTGGIVRTPLPAGLAGRIESIVRRTDGTIVAAANVLTAPTPTLAFARYDDDGALDATFGTGGLVFTTSPAEMAGSLVLTADDRLIAGGGNAIARFLDDGSPDTAWGSGGVVMPTGALGSISVDDLVQQPDGRLLVGGRMLIAGAVNRYDAGGMPDATFGTGGSAPFSLGFDTIVRSSVALLPDGRVVVIAVPASGFTASMLRFLANGQPDPTVDPVVHGGVRGLSKYFEPTGAVADADGNVAMSGRRAFPTLTPPFERAFWGHVPPTQAPDVVDETANDVTASADGVAVQADGRFVVVGTYGPRGGSGTEVHVQRFEIGPCGNLQVDPGEDCDWSVDACCALDCSWITGACDDGDECTTDDRCTVGVCVGQPFVPPLPCVTCENGIHSVGPREDCKQLIEPDRSTLTIQNSTSPQGDRVTWRWNNGEATTPGELGDPIAGSTQYDFCVFQSPGTSLIATRASTAGGCAKPPCWRRSGTKLVYKSAPPNASGLTGLTLMPGGDGKSTIQLKAKGSNLLVAPMPFGLPLRVQIGASPGGACWEAWFTSDGVRKHTSTKLVARAGPP
jgi:uncharacterized delta-60 repeat protein